MESPETLQVIAKCWLCTASTDHASDIMLVRMTSDSVRPPEQRYNYRNALSGCIDLVKKEGLAGLTRGLSTNLVRVIRLISSTFLYGFFAD